MNKQILMMCFLLLVLVFLSACSNPTSNVIKEEQYTEIGVILPLTGPGAAYGIPEKEGIELGLEELNNHRATPIKLIFEDSETEPSAGVIAFNKLIQISKVKTVIGAMSSSVTLAISPIAEQNQIILISPGSSNPELSNAGDYIFRLYPSDDYQGKILADYVKKNKLTNTGILYLNNDYGLGLKNKFKEEYTKDKNYEVITEVAYNRGEKDFRTYLTKLKKDNIKTILIIAAGQENANILIQAKELGLNDILPDLKVGVSC